MSRHYEHSIDDIIDSLDKIQSYVVGFTEPVFEKDSIIQDAVIRRLEIIGEATKNVPPDFREKYPTIPWRSLAGLRDVVIHQYFGVSIAMIWKVTQVDIPILIESFEEITRNRNQ